MFHRKVRNLGIAVVVGLTLTVALVGGAAAQEPGKFYAGLTQYEATAWENLQLSGCEATDNQLVHVTVFPVGSQQSVRHLELSTDHGCFRGEFQAPQEPGKYRVWVRQYGGDGQADPNKNTTLYLAVVGEAATPKPAPPTPRPVVAPAELTMTLPMTAETGSIVTATLVVSPASAWPLEMSFQIGEMAPLEWRGSNITQTITFTPAVAGIYPVTVTVTNEAGEALVSGTFVVTGETYAVAPIVGLAPTGGEAPAGPRINPFTFLAAILMAIVVVGAVVGIRRWAASLQAQQVDE